MLTYIDLLTAPSVELVDLCCLLINSHGIPFSGIIRYRGLEKWQFSTEIAIYHQNGAKQAYGYYVTLTANFWWLMQWRKQGHCLPLSMSHLWPTMSGHDILGNEMS